MACLAFFSLLSKIEGEKLQVREMFHDGKIWAEYGRKTGPPPDYLCAGPQGRQKTISWIPLGRSSAQRPRNKPHSS